MPIITLSVEQLQFLIYDTIFEQQLSVALQRSKDLFVFGCTVALRFSDLVKLNKSNIRVTGGQHYLTVRSQKTSTDSLVKLPPYAVEILLRYSMQKKRLLPLFNKVNLNKYIKLLLEQAGFTHIVCKTRERRGQAIELKKMNGMQVQSYRFCDAASTHTMRRTAVTTMLCLGVPEQVVRRISGHSPNSKEFYRYVLWAQTYQDAETEKMFEKLQQKKMAAG